MQLKRIGHFTKTAKEKNINFLFFFSRFYTWYENIKKAIYLN